MDRRTGGVESGECPIGPSPGDARRADVAERAIATRHVVRLWRVVPRANPGGRLRDPVARLGLASEFDLLNPIPEPERFFAGGDTTVRGFALDTLGVRHNPTDPLTDTIDPNGFPIGGNATVILNGELRVPLTGGLSVVSFFDTGNVFQRVTTMSVAEFRNAVGFGVRYKPPFGPLRVDLGFKTHVEAFPCNADTPTVSCFESRPALHISFGQAF